MDSENTTPILQYSNTPFRSPERHAFLWVIASLITLSWLILWLWDRSPYSRYLRHDELGAIASTDAASVFLVVALYVVGWTLMTVAMMLPTTLPLLGVFRRLVAERQKTPNRGNVDGNIIATV